MRVPVRVAVTVELTKVVEGSTVDVLLEARVDVAVRVVLAVVDEGRAVDRGGEVELADAEMVAKVGRRVEVEVLVEFMLTMELALRVAEGSTEPTRVAFTTSAVAAATARGVEGRDEEPLRG